MAGFYMYFAITKRDFTLGSWRERIIAVSHAPSSAVDPQLTAVGRTRRGVFTTRMTSLSLSALRAMTQPPIACFDCIPLRYKVLLQKSLDLDAAIVKAKAQVAFIA